MITRFRVEGEGPDKQGLIEEISSAASKIIGAIDPETVDADGWECTDDVITGDEQRGYRGRMVFRTMEYQSVSPFAIPKLRDISQGAEK